MAAPQLAVADRTQTPPDGRGREHDRDEKSPHQLISGHTVSAVTQFDLRTRWLGGAVALARFIGRYADADSEQAGANDPTPRVISAVIRPPVWIDLAAGRNVIALGIGSRGAGRQRRDRSHCAGLNIDLAAIVINNRGAAARSNHDGVADIGDSSARDRLKTLTLIDGEIAVTRLDYRSPRGGGDEYRTTD